MIFINGCSLLTQESEVDIAQQIWGAPYDTQTVMQLKEKSLSGMPNALVKLIKQLKRTEMQYCIQTNQDIKKAMQNGYCKPLSPEQVEELVPYWDTRYALLVAKGILSAKKNDFYEAELFRINGNTANLIEEFENGKNYDVTITGNNLLITYESIKGKQLYQRKY